MFKPEDFVTRAARIACMAMATVLLAGPATALEPTDIAGDYALAALDIDYGGTFPPPVDEGDFSTLAGYLSATSAGVVYEMTGQDTVNFNTYDLLVAGRFEISGTTVTVRRANATGVNVTMSMPNANTLVVQGVALDSNRQAYNYTLRFSRLEHCYTQQQLDDAVADATADLYTQQELDDAVAAATADLYTQAELDAAVQAALDSCPEPETIRVPVVIPLMD
jgi:hypothetical protein